MELSITFDQAPPGDITSVSGQRIPYEVQLAGFKQAVEEGKIPLGAFRMVAKYDTGTLADNKRKVTNQVTSMRSRMTTKAKNEDWRFRGWPIADADGDPMKAADAPYGVWVAYGGPKVNAEGTTTNVTEPGEVATVASNGSGSSEGTQVPAGDQGDQGGQVADQAA